MQAPTCVFAGTSSPGRRCASGVDYDAIQHITLNSPSSFDDNSIDFRMRCTRCGVLLAEVEDRTFLEVLVSKAFDHRCALIEEAG